MKKKKIKEVEEPKGSLVAKFPINLIMYEIYSESETVFTVYRIDDMLTKVKVGDTFNSKADAIQGAVDNFEKVYA